MSFLRAENITKHFRNHCALNNVNISVPEGHIFGLLGPNGAGKTTLLRIINQIYAADQGIVYLEGRPINRGDVQHIGYLPEERGLYKKMKVQEQLVYLGKLKGLSKQTALEQFNAWSERLGITTWHQRKLMDLSKGMQQKVQFISAVIHSPKLLVLDEPFSGFDPVNAQQIQEQILQLKKQGTTIIFSSHNMGSVEELCDDIALINKSEVILSGSVQAIIDQHKTNTYEVTFSSPVNRISLALSDQYKILDLVEGENKIVLEAKLAPNASTNDLLQKCLKAGTVSSFKELMPKLHDIFIQTVNKQNQ